MPALLEKPRAIPPHDDVLFTLCRKSLVDYIAQAWHVVEPSTAFVSGKHISVICEHLQAVSNGEIRNLVINMPPRHAKSLLVSVFWPTWEWIRYPERRWLFASYAQTLSTRDSLKCRRIIQSPWYQKLFGDRYQLTGDQNQKTRFDNDKTGYRLATSVGGVATGEGGDRIVVDDPHNVQEAESEAVREATIIWWDESMSTRGNDPKTVARVIVMQRVHDQDLTGHVLEQGGYEHLCLPAEYEGAKKFTSLGAYEWREEEGQLLWPQRFGRAEIDDLKAHLGPYGTAGQLQQDPVPRKGGMFELGWFRFEQDYPRDMVAYVRYWDKASAEVGKGDWTVGALMGRDRLGKFWLLDVVRGQWNPGTRNTTILNTALLDRQKYGNVKIYVEQEPGAGKESTENLLLLLSAFNAERDLVSVAKMERAEPLSASARNGNVHVLIAPWNDEVMSVITRFPNAAHDDDVDAVSGAHKKLAEYVSVHVSQSVVYTGSNLELPSPSTPGALRQDADGLLIMPMAAPPSRRLL